VKRNLKKKLNEKKLARKTERILNLEKQLHETKDLVGQYKGKIESLKALISVSNSNNVPMHEIMSENSENVDPIANMSSNTDSRIDSTIDEHRHHHDDPSMRKSISSATSARIVKFIRGGQNKTKSAIPTRLNFSSFSIPNSDNKVNKIEPNN